LNSDPSFVNTGAYDFRLQNGSIWIDSGYAIWSLDAFWQLTSQWAGYDIWAYEYLTGAVNNNSEEYILMDFEDSVLHDEDWIKAQPIWTVASYVHPKWDSWVNDLLLDIWAWRWGWNALLVESTDSSMWLPSFWLLRAKNAGVNYIQNIKDKSGYFLPENKKANRFEFWVKFEDWYRPTLSWLNQNFQVGTYQFDPNKIDGSNDVKESDGWHFYHHMMIRHDVAKDGWIHVVLNQSPQHMRAISALPANNPTQPYGNYWELLTRFYIDAYPYFADPEKWYPLKMWIDDIKLSYVEEWNDIDVDMVSYIQWEDVPVTAEIERDFLTKITNNTSAEICWKIHNATPWWMSSKFIDEDTVSILDENICISWGWMKQFYMRIKPQTGSNLSDWRKNTVWVSFVPNAQIQNADFTSFSDSNVENRATPYGIASHDAVIFWDFITTVAQGDIIPPVLSSGAPSGEQASGTTNTLLSVSTDENAFCKYSTSVNTAYSLMTNNFSTTWNTSHSVNIAWLTDGVSYTYYVRCIDGSSNENTSDYEVSFSVAEIQGILLPSISAVSWIYENDNIITVSWIDFWIKTQSAPVLWDYGDDVYEKGVYNNIRENTIDNTTIWRPDIIYEKSSIENFNSASDAPVFKRDFSERHTWVNAHYFLPTGNSFVGWPNTYGGALNTPTDNQQLYVSWWFKEKYEWMKYFAIKSMGMTWSFIPWEELINTNWLTWTYIGMRDDRSLWDRMHAIINETTNSVPLRNTVIRGVTSGAEMLTSGDGNDYYIPWSTKYIRGWERDWASDAYESQKFLSTWSNGSLLARKADGTNARDDVRMSLAPWEWHHMEYSVDLDSNIMQASVDGQVTNTVDIADSVRVDGKYSPSIALLGFNGQEYFNTSELGEIYMDSSLQRIILSEKSTWDLTQKTHYEIQYPTNWTDTSISFELYQWSFLANQDAYIYIVKKDGSVNTEGYKITLWSTPSDTTAPSLSNWTPSGEQASGTTNTTLSITTDENAFCKYSTTADTVYSSIINSFSITWNTAHSVNITWLTDGSSYTYYVRCIDWSSNENTSDYLINFNVESLSVVDTIIFEDNFDDQPDWQTDTKNSLGSIPLGWDAGRTDEQWHPFSASWSMPSMLISGDDVNKVYGSSGKSFISYSESFNDTTNNGFTSDGFITKDILPREEVNIEFKIKFQPGFAADSEGGQIKLFRLLSWNGISPRNKFFTSWNSWPIYIYDWAQNTYGLRHFHAFRCDDQETNYFCTNPAISDAPREISSGDMSANFTTDISSFPNLIPDLENGGVIPTSGIISHNQVYGTDWHKMEYNLRQNSWPWVRDGILKVWLDGNVIIDMKQIPWIWNDGDMNSKWNSFSIGWNDNFHFNLDSLAPVSDRERWYAIDDVIVYNPVTSWSPLWSTSPRDGRLPDDYVIGWWGTTTPVDTIPPVPSNGLPTGEQASGTTNTTLSITTDENAFCKYSTTADTVYSSIINSFSITWNTAHSVNITWLTDGSSYTYYVRCIDWSSNENISDYEISFSIAESITVTPTWNILFEDNFDDHPDWYVVDGSEECDGIGWCDGAIPNGWSYLRNIEAWHPDNGFPTKKPGQSISNEQFRWTTGKSWIKYQESSKAVWNTAWGDDAMLIKSLSGSYDEVNMSFWIKVDPDWQWVDSFFKLARIYSFDGPDGVNSPWNFFSSGYSAPIFLLDLKSSPTYGYRSVAALRCDPQVSDYYCGTYTDTYNSPWGGTNASTTFTDPFDDGEWHHLEIKVWMNSEIWVADGTAQYWLDGVEEFSLSDIPWRSTWSSLSNKFNTFWIGWNTYNWFSDPSNQAEQWYAIDDVVVYTPIDSSHPLWDESPKDGRLPDSYVIGWGTSTGVSDITAPILSNWAPSGEQASGTTSINLTLDTDENATCKYSTSVNTTYSSMTNNFSMTWNISHSVNISWLIDGGSYTYYIRCIDTSSNENAWDYTLSFSVQTASLWWGGGGWWWGGGWSYISKCNEEDLVCSLVPWSDTTYKWYKKEGISCSWYLLWELCWVHTYDDESTDLNSTWPIDDTISGNGGWTVKKYHSTMSLLKLIERRVDKVITQKKKGTDKQIIEYRNTFIKDIENYIVARQARQNTKEHKLKILTTFKVFAKELRKDVSPSGWWIKRPWIQSNVKRFIPENDTVKSLWEKLDVLIIKYKKEKSVKVLFFKTKLLKNIDWYINAKKSKDWSMHQKIKLKILKINIKKVYKIFLKSLKS